MFTDKATVLLILSREVLDRARVLAGNATATLKLPVSLQIVLRALVEEGLKRNADPALLANIENQAKTVRHIRSVARRGAGAAGDDGDRRSGIRRKSSGGERPRRRK